MNKQSKALRIASMLDGNECCKGHGGQGSHPSTCGECPRTAADELRRLHALNAELVHALESSKQCIADFLEVYKNGSSMVIFDLACRDLKNDALKLVHAALTKHKNEVAA